MCGHVVQGIFRACLPSVRVRVRMRGRRGGGARRLFVAKDRAHV